MVSRIVKNYVDYNEYKNPVVEVCREEENFFTELNKALYEKELSLYKDYNETYPSIFVFGLPRSGGTLMSQLITQCFDVGYINNFMAKFWLSPVIGIKMSKYLLKNNSSANFESIYAITNSLTDIHEFSFFWRFWLKKHSHLDFTDIESKEVFIDWNMIKKILLNIQYEFGKSVCYRNGNGSYHIKKFSEMLDKVIYVYIERDPLDVAISILEARKKFYGDVDIWWSSYPPEYNRIKDLPCMEQIAGQVYYLKKFYDDQFKSVKTKNMIRVSYKDVCNNPLNVLQSINTICEESCNCSLDTINTPPTKFNYSVYKDRDEEKEQLKMLFERFNDEK